MKIKKPIICLLLFISLFDAFTQQKGFDVNFRNTPANVALLKLAQQYKFQISFNDAELAKYPITAVGNFTNMNDLFFHVLKNIPFSYESTGTAYIVYFDETKAKDINFRTITVQGSLTDEVTGESLPYGTIIINGELRITDNSGRFSFIAFSDEWLNVKASYLGYMFLDTTIISQPRFTFKLKPSANILSETIVKGQPIAYGLQVGQSAGSSRLNPKLTNFITGGNNNGIGGLIMIQPGIQSSGSGFGNMSVWGSYPGQNNLIFDGMTLFTYPLTSEYIFPINTLVVKDVMIDKGALSAHHGDHVGGVIEVTGIDGHSAKPEFIFSPDGLLINAMVSYPLKKQTKLVFATRQPWDATFYKQMPSYTSFKNYHLTDFSPKNLNYSDINFKVTHAPANGDRLALSFYANNIIQNETFKSSAVSSFFGRHNKHQWQWATSALWGHSWHNGVTSNIYASSVSANVINQTDTAWFTPPAPSPFAFSTPFSKNNQCISEHKLGIDNRFPLSTRHFVEAGWIAHQTNTKTEILFNNQLKPLASKTDKTSAYVRNHIYANKFLLMDIGLRLDYVFQSNQYYFQPRIKGSLMLSDLWKFNFNWGIYTQYLALISHFDLMQNTDFIWHGYSNKTEFLQSNVLSAGASYTPNSLTLSAEFYTKTVDGLARYQTGVNGIELYKGHAQTNGIDLLIKKEFGKHAIWQAVTMAQTKEMFQNDLTYHKAPFSRDIESKTHIMINQIPFQIGVSVVYASPTIAHPMVTLIAQHYFRVDARLSYQTQIAKRFFEIGLSCYNLTNSKNLSSLQMRRFSLNETTENIGLGRVPFILIGNLTLKL